MTTSAASSAALADALADEAADPVVHPPRAADERVNLVAGDARESSSPHRVVVHDPHTGERVGAVPAGNAADVDLAVAAARAEADAWARTAPAERAAAVKEAARRLAAVADDVALMNTRETGKPLGDARGGVDAAVGALQQYAELGPLHRGKALQGGWGATDLMVPVPRGVVAVLTAWNDPVALLGQGLGAALVAGNTVVVSPSERAPLCSHALVDCFDHLPAGVVNLVHGDSRAGAPLAAHPEVDVVYHVGSSLTGRDIAVVCASRGAKAVLEGGGADPVLVDADVDPTWAAEQVALGAFANAGQICTSVERVYVHEAVAEEFVAALVEQAGTWTTGDPRQASTRLGPLVDTRMRDAVHAQVRAAVAAGARVEVGGEVPDGPGAHYPATVLTGCTDDMAVMAEETFGPVAPVRVCTSFDEMLRLAAANRYGLAATVLSADQAHVQEAWRALPVGTVKVNAVFGGAPGGAATPRGASGEGFGYGPELLDELTATKVVHLEPAVRRT